MDILGAFIIILFLIAILYPYFVFFKELKKTEKNQLKHKVIYILISVVISFSIVCLVAFIVQHWHFKRRLTVNLNFSRHIYRIFFASIIIFISTLTNLYIVRFYLKRIIKPKKENEIELIGEE